MKRLLAVLLCALMLAGILPFGALADEEPAAEEPEQIVEAVSEEKTEEEPTVEVKLKAETGSCKVGDTVKLTATYRVNGEKESADFTWYTVNSNKEKTAISGASKSTYTFEAKKAGEFRFAVAVGDTCSKIVTVTVEEAESEAKAEEPAEEVPEVKAEEPAEEPKAEEPEVKAEEPKTEEPEVKAEEPKAEEPEVKAEEPKAEEPEVKAEEPKAEEPEAKAEEPKAEEPEVKAEEPKAEEPEVKAEEPKAEEPEVKAEEPKAEEPEAKAEEPKAEEPEVKAEEPKAEEPEVKAEEPKAEEPEVKAEEPKAEEPEVKAEEPKAEEPEVKAEEPKAEEPEVKAEEPKAEEPEVKAEEPKAEEPEVKAEEPKAEEPEVKAEEPKAEEPEVKAEEPKAEEPEVKAEEPKAEEPEEDEGPEGLLLASKIPVIKTGTFTITESNADIGEKITLKASVTFDDPSVVAKVKYEWYKTDGKTAIKLGTTTDTATYKYQVNYSDNSYSMYCCVTAYDANNNASAIFTTATDSVVVNAKCSTSDLSSNPGTNDLAAVISDANGASITITVDNKVTLTSLLTVPSTVTIKVKGTLIVSVTGGKLVNNGKLWIYNGGTFECQNTSAYSGSRIWMQSTSATITPNSLPHGIDGKTIDTINTETLTIGTKVPLSSEPSGYKYVAASGQAAPISFEYEPDDAWDQSLTITSNLDGTVPYNSSKKTVTLTKTGTHTITIKTPTSNTYTFKVEVSPYEITVYDNNDSAHQQMLTAGNDLTITVKLKPANMTKTELQTPALSTADQQYATITDWYAEDDGNTYKIHLHAKNITEKQTVKVYIATKDGKAAGYSGYPYYSVTIYPTPLEVRAFWVNHPTNPGKQINGETIYFDIDGSMTNVTIEGDVLPSPDASQAITWTYTDSNPQKCAKVTITDNGTDHAVVKVSPSGNKTEGIVTLTGKSYSGAVVEVPIRMLYMDTSIKIDVPSSPGYLRVRAGTPLAMSATLGTSVEGYVKWSMDTSKASWGSINRDSGVFTATNYASQLGKVQEVKITATLYINGIAVASDSTNIKVVPTAQKAYISMNSETFKSGATIKLNASAGNSWTLTGSLKPDNLGDTKIPRLTGNWSTSDASVVSVSPLKSDRNKCVISAVGPGTATITFAADDGSGVKTTIKVNITYQVSSITVWTDAAHTKKESELIGGSSLQLYSVVKPSNASNPSLKYEIINCDSSFNPDSKDPGVYATVSTLGKVTAKTVYSEHFVIVRVSSTDGGLVSTDYKLKIVPKQGGNLVILDKNGYDITGTTLKFDVLAGSTMQLQVPGYEDATFSSSSPSKVKVDSTTGKVTCVVNPSKKAYTVTITATDNKNPARKAKVRLTVTKLMQPGTLSITSKSGSSTLSAGSKMALTKKVTSSCLNKNVIWSIDENSREYATVSANGIVTAKKNLYEKTDITVTATAKDGSGVKATFKITLTPRATSVLIEDSSSKVISGKTVTVSYNTGYETLSASVLSADAKQDVSWKTSNKKVATVTQSGKVHFTGKIGKVVITATAKDGSKKSARVTYQVIRKVKDFELNLTGKNTYSGKLAVRGGSSVQIKVKFTNPTKPTNSKIKWVIGDPSDPTDTSAAYASVTTAGKLTAVAVTGAHKIKVTAIPLDDPDGATKKTFEVWILPAVTGITIKSGAVNVTGTTITVGKNKTINLTASIFPTDASKNVTWTTSNSKIATVNDGVVKTKSKAGRVIITVKAKDGSGKSARVIFKVG